MNARADGPKTKQGADALISGDTPYPKDAVVILALLLIPGLGNKTVNRIIAMGERHGCDLASLPGIRAETACRRFPELNPTVACKLQGCDSNLFAAARARIEDAATLGITPVTVTQAAYPAPFRTCLGESAPPLIFLCGNPALLDEAAGAVVGTRSPSPKGKGAARKAAQIIVAKALCLVSGGAVGVDWNAHDAAIAAGANTLIVLPQGAGTYALPRTWRAAFDAGRILLLSEALPDAPWRTHAAVSRNALISAQARFVCAIEPRKQGGSILTTRHALRQRKAVFVEPITALPESLQPHAAPLDALSGAIEEILRTPAHPCAGADIQTELL